MSDSGIDKLKEGGRDTGINQKGGKWRGVGLDHDMIRKKKSLFALFAARY